MPLPYGEGRWGALNGVLATIPFPRRRRQVLVLRRFHLTVGEGLDPPLHQRYLSCWFLSETLDFCMENTEQSSGLLGRVKTLPYGEGRWGPVNKLFTDYSIFPLAFSCVLRYYVLALRR